MGASSRVPQPYHIAVGNRVVHHSKSPATFSNRSPATLAPAQSLVVGIGPQVGFIFPVGEGYQGYLNVKAYKDFAAENRPEGYTAWLTLAVSPATPIPNSAVQRCPLGVLAPKRIQSSMYLAAGFILPQGYFDSIETTRHHPPGPPASDENMRDSRCLF